jgi:hypothetical protein
VRTIGIKVRFADISTVTWARTRPPPVNELETVWRWPRTSSSASARPSPWLVGVRVAGLDRDEAAAADQLSLLNQTSLDRGISGSCIGCASVSAPPRTPYPAGQPSGTPRHGHASDGFADDAPKAEASPLGKVDHTRLRGRS